MRECTIRFSIWVFWFMKNKNRTPFGSVPNDFGFPFRKYISKKKKKTIVSNRFISFSIGYEKMITELVNVLFGSIRIG